MPDCRVKVAPQAKPVIAERVNGGESTAQVAADLKVTQQTGAEIQNAMAGIGESMTGGMANASGNGNNFNESTFSGFVAARLGGFQSGDKAVEDNTARTADGIEELIRRAPPIGSLPGLPVV